MADAPTETGSRKSQTRERLLQAAAEIVAEKGFGGVSLMDIAERAQLTTGAVYSNFRSKEALLLALVASELDRMSSGPPRSPAEVVELARAAGSLVRDPSIHDVLRAQVEIYLLGLRDASVRVEMERREKALADGLADVLRQVKDVDLDAPPPTLPQLAELFFATIQGLQQHRLMFPDALPLPVFEWWAATILRTAAQVNATTD